MLTTLKGRPRLGCVSADGRGLPFTLQAQSSGLCGYIAEVAYREHQEMLTRVLGKPGYSFPDRCKPPDVARLPEVNEAPERGGFVYHGRSRAQDRAQLGIETVGTALHPCTRG